MFSQNARRFCSRGRLSSLVGSRQSPVRSELALGFRLDPTSRLLATFSLDGAIREPLG